MNVTAIYKPTVTITRMEQVYLAEQSFMEDT